MSAETNKIWIVTAKELSGARDMYVDAGGIYANPDGSLKTSRSLALTPVDAETFKTAVKDFIEMLGEAFDQIERQPSQMQLDEIELSAEIDAEGRVALWGIGGGVGGQGAIKLVFRRKET